jgi:hypothetical protein
MRTLSLHLHRPDHFEAVASRLAAFEPDVVLAFGSSARFAPDGPAVRLAGRVPRSVVAGCSGAGEIHGAGVHDHTLSLVALRFDRAHARLAASALGGRPDSDAAGARAAAALPREGLRHVLLFAPGADIDGSALVRGAQSVLGAAVGISGGLAGDGGGRACTPTLAGACADARQVVAVGLYGSALRVASAAGGGWEPFGPARRASVGCSNMLYRLDGERALDVYRRYLGDYAADLPASGPLFPFEVLDAEHRPTGLMRTLVAVDEAQGALALGGDVPADGYLRLMHATADRLIDAAEAAAARLGAGDSTRRGDAFALLVSCDGRRLLMGDRTDEEADAVASCLGDDVALCGFYSYGEIAHAEYFGDCRLHNQAATVTWLCEG